MSEPRCMPLAGRTRQWLPSERARSCRQRSRNGIGTGRATKSVERGIRSRCCSSFRTVRRRTHPSRPPRQGQRIPRNERRRENARLEKAYLGVVPFADRVEDRRGTASRRFQATHTEGCHLVTSLLFVQHPSFQGSA